MIVTFWTSKQNDWRTRWIRYAADGPATHVTCTTQGLTLHTDRVRVGWYNMHKIYNLYEDIYEPYARFLILGEYVTSPTKPPGNTWDAIKWKYLGGKRPQGCTQTVIDCLEFNGFKIPEHYVDPNHLLEYLNDCNWAIREGSNGEESFDPRIVYRS